MTLPNISATDELAQRRASDELGRRRAALTTQPAPLANRASAVSWSSIAAGATAAAALTLILSMLGTGLGLSSVSPWAYTGVTAKTLGVSTILWLTFTQLIASGLGGYLAGRLRTKWVAVHTDEVFFRDTAHGFLAWAVSALMTVALLSSMIGSIVSSGIQAGSMAAAATTGSAAVGAEMAKYNAEPMAYFMDSLFRKDIYAVASSAILDESGAMQRVNKEPAESEAEITRIFMNSIATGPLPAEDSRYAGQLVAQHTGLTQQAAEKRVTDIYARIQSRLRTAEIAAKEAVDSARKASVYASLWFFISLLIGAFVASFAATYGGRQRDM